MYKLIVTLTLTLLSFTTLSSDKNHCEKIHYQGYYCVVSIINALEEDNSKLATSQLSLLKKNSESRKDYIFGLSSLALRLAYNEKALNSNSKKNLFKIIENDISKKQYDEFISTNEVGKARKSLQRLEENNSLSVFDEVMRNDLILKQDKVEMIHEAYRTEKISENEYFALSEGLPKKERVLLYNLTLQRIILSRADLYNFQVNEFMKTLHLAGGDLFSDSIRGKESFCGAFQYLNQQVMDVIDNQEFPLSLKDFKAYILSLSDYTKRDISTFRCDGKGLGEIVNQSTNSTIFEITESRENDNFNYFSDDIEMNSDLDVEYHINSIAGRSLLIRVSRPKGCQESEHANRMLTIMVKKRLRTNKTGKFVLDIGEEKCSTSFLFYL